MKAAELLASLLGSQVERRDGASQENMYIYRYTYTNKEIKNI